MNPSLAPAPYVTIPLAAKILGLSEPEIQARVDSGAWRPGVEYVVAPDRKVLIAIYNTKNEAPQPIPRTSSPAKPPSGVTQLYRHFDAAGALLYVGVSLNSMLRLAQHGRDAGWFAEITRVDVQTFPTRAEALAAEKTAIQAEKPRHNIIHARKSA